MYLPRGAFAPVPTAVKPDGEIDHDAILRHLNWLADEGLDGALILGTNGEFPSFSLPERAVIGYAAREAKSRLKLLLNIGGCAMEDVQQMSLIAERLGYSAALLPPPWYWRNAPLEGLAAFFRKALDICKVPVLLYHIPQVTGIPISDELLDRIGPHERLIGVKDSSGDEAEMARLLPRFADGAYLVGHDKLVAKCLQSGGHGSISACASLVPKLVKSIESDPIRQADLNKVRATLEKYGLGAAVKSELRRKGFGKYGTRPPMVGLNEAQEVGLAVEMDRLAV